ncbi:peroxisomal sarcosine oxidase isoform X2 [Cyrtonyx montezumae]|uniref:peroxisomal sarcosine oxidase isoform X2 n=1 Tax=Cyrtonyx montezumae TaxID=9017 RepID=UPI0032DA51AE
MGTDMAAPGQPRCASYDAIVIGAGIQGSFAAYHLALRHRDTLLLEQFFLPHSRGSSHGQSRIIRSAYPQEHYARMMPHSFHLWQQLEDEAGTPLYRRTGLVVLGPAGDPELEGCRRSLGPGDILDEGTLTQRFLGLHPRRGDVALWDGSGGVLQADRALRAVQDAFRRRGGTVRDGEKVLRIDPGAVLTVTTTAGVYRAPRLIITAGAWTNAVVAPLGLHLPLQEKEPGSCSAVTPCFIATGLPYAPHGIYGLPALEYPGLVKVCYHYGSPTDPEERDRTLPGSPRPHVALLSNFISSYLPGLETQPAVMESCLYTNTPDEDFILDRHPKYNNIIIGAGFSGHGFKLAPVVGQLLCELSLGEKPSHCMAPFAISRFPGVLCASL